jgi:protein-S-isoprenylcysteine O-methyltransferase Ste14
MREPNVFLERIECDYPFWRWVMVKTISPPLLYQIAIVLLILFHFLFPIAKIIHFPFNLIGIIIFVLGAGFAINAKRLFQKTNTPIKPSDLPINLHQRGPFRFSRNPMYLGISIGLLGIAIILGSVSAFLFPIMFFVVMDLVFIPHEEKAMQSAFGEEYQLYKSKIHRWI